MITAIDSKNNDLALNVSLLSIGDSGTKYAFVNRVSLKYTVNGELFFQFILKSVDNKIIIGRLFGNQALALKDKAFTFVNTVVAISYVVSEVYGKKSLDLDWVEGTSGELPESIKTELFHFTIPNIDEIVKSLHTLFNKYTCSYTSVISMIFNTSSFSKLAYVNDPEILNASCGYPYAILLSAWKHYEDYLTVGLITKKEYALAMCVQVVCESVLFSIDKANFAYTLKVITNVNKLLDGCKKISTDTEFTELQELASTYLNLRLGINSYTEVQLGRLMFNEFNTVMNNMIYLSSKESKIVIDSNDKLLK